MTTTVTPREIRSPRNGRVPNLDSPAVSTPARARITVTKRNRKIGDRIAVAGRRWWAFTTRPVSLAALWRLSAVDPTRIPASSPALRWAWQVSNWTDRLLLFALILVSPSVCTGPLRWCATRPTRRYGLHLTVAALTAAYLIGRK